MHRAVRTTLAVLMTGLMSAQLAGCSKGPYADQPEQQRDFVLFLVTAGSKWRGATNSLQRESMPSERDEGLCRFGDSAKNWVGIVSDIGSYMGQGYVFVKLKVFENIIVRTGGELQDDSFKIARTSEMFDTLSRLTKGSKVVFSGKFDRGRNGCIKEVSLTNNGGFTEPEFIMSFTDLRAAG